MFKFRISVHRILLVMVVSGTGIFFISCGPKESSDPAQRAVDRAMRVHGSYVFDHSIIEFKFRDRRYKSTRMDGHFRYDRFWDSTGLTIHDEFSNTGFIRYVGQTRVILDAKKINAYTSSVNSVLYFFGLPFNLNDPSVIKEYLGEVTLMDQRYDKVKVSFKPNPDDRMIHDDTYVYWFNKKNHFMDYIGYTYTEPEETGTRFRQAINRRQVDGFTVQDYINFKPIHDSIAIAVKDLDQAWAGNQLKEVSRIINESVKVTIKK